MNKLELEVLVAIEKTFPPQTSGNSYCVFRALKPPKHISAYEQKGAYSGIYLILYLCADLARSVAGGPLLGGS